MKKNLLKDKKGFTLVELIVVLVILAILIALLVPSLTGYIDKARKKAKMTECRQAVEAAQTELSELYGKAEGADTATLQSTITSSGKIGDIQKLAEVPGTIESIVVQETAVISKLVYVAADGTRVIYERDGDPQYRVEDDGEKSYSKDAPGYWEQIGDLDKTSYDPQAFLDENGKLKDEYKKYFSSVSEMKQNESRRIQAAYLEKYGEFATVDWGQISYPSGVKGVTSENARWKPIATSDGKTVLVADTRNDVGAAQGAVVYYDGNYYYHNQHSGNSQSSSVVYINDKNFKIDDLMNTDNWTVFNK